MKKVKRIASLILALAMVFAMCMSSFAADTEEPCADDTAPVYVYNVEEGVTVAAYQLISAVYDSKGNGLTGYEIASAISGYSLTMESPTSDQISAIAAAVYDGRITDLTKVYLSAETFTNSSGEEDVRYTADLAAGMWLILVYDSGLKTYNPMIVSNWYTDANDASSLVPGYVDADGYFVEAQWTDSSDDTVESRTYTENATLIYAKSSEITAVKEITNYTEDTAYGEESSSGAAYNTGDTVSFSITTTMPDYSDAYINSKSTTKFTVFDNLGTGFDEVDEDTITVTVGGTAYSEYYVDSSTGLRVYNYVFTHNVNEDGSQYLEFAFTQTFIDEHPSNTIVITYDAVLNDDAFTTGDSDADPNINSAGIEATNDPDSTVKKYTEVYIYSFSITDEIVKVSPYGTASSDGNAVTVTNPLAGAEFTIYTDSSCSDEYIYTNASNTTGVSVSDENGYISFTGLAEGTYYITETESPDDYMINDTVYKIVIEAEYDLTDGSATQGLLTSYTITVTDLTTQEEYVNTYAVNNSMEENSETYTSTDSETSITYTWYSFSGADVSAGQNPVAVVDPDLIKLPSTGGMGIYVVLGISVMILAAGAFFVLRKKDGRSNA